MNPLASVSDPLPADALTRAPHVPHTRSKAAPAAPGALRVTAKTHRLVLTPGIFRRSVIGQAELTRADLQEALDASAYGTVTLQGFAKGRIAKLTETSRKGASLAATGALVGLAAASGLVVPLGQFVGVSVLLAGAAMAFVADMAKRDTARQHAVLAKRIATTPVGDALPVPLVQEVTAFTQAPPPRAFRPFAP